MGATLKMTKEDVESYLTKINALLSVAEFDLKAFENINAQVLTPSNCAASTKIKKLFDMDSEGIKERRKAINNCIANLNIAKHELNRYAEAIGLI